MTATAARLEAVPEATDRPQNVIDALARVMVELPAIGKGSTASAQQGGYSYRGIEAVTARAQTLFGRYGIVFVPRVRSCEIQDLVVNGKPWTDTILSVTYKVYGPGGVADFIKVGPLTAIGRDNSDKGANKAMTQAFKYALLQTLCISDKKDDADGSNHEADAVVRRTVPAKDDLAEAKDTLKDVLGLLGDLRPACVTHLKDTFGPANGMTLEQTNQAIEIATGWPGTGPQSDEQPGSNEASGATEASAEDTVSDTPASGPAVRRTRTTKPKAKPKEEGSSAPGFAKDLHIRATALKLTDLQFDAVVRFVTNDRTTSAKELTSQEATYTSDTLTEIEKGELVLAEGAAGWTVEPKF